MSIRQIQHVTHDGIRHVPALSDYTAHSDGWREAEYRTGTGRADTLAGYWEGEPGWVSFSAWPYTEICVILSGRVAIEDAEGARRTFGGGEAFVVPAGFAGRWVTLEPTTKYFIAVGDHEPSPSA